MADPANDAILLTVFLKPDQSRTLAEIEENLEKNKFWTTFPPEGIEVVSWYVLMGLAQVVTVRVPPHRLREVNRSIEHSAWGTFRTEFYTTYDYRAVWEANRDKPRD